MFAICRPTGPVDTVDWMGFLNHMFGIFGSFFLISRSSESSVKEAGVAAWERREKMGRCKKAQVVDMEKSYFEVEFHVMF